MFRCGRDADPWFGRYRAGTLYRIGKRSEAMAERQSVCIVDRLVPGQRQKWRASAVGRRSGGQEPNRTPFPSGRQLPTPQQQRNGRLPAAHEGETRGRSWDHGHRPQAGPHLLCSREEPTGIRSDDVGTTGSGTATPHTSQDQKASPPPWFSTRADSAVTGAGGTGSLEATRPRAAGPYGRGTWRELTV